MTLSPQIESGAARAGPAPLEAAVLRAVIYADVFDFPLTVTEIHRFLERQTAALSEVRAVVETSTWLAARLGRVECWYMLKGREALAERRAEQMAQAYRLWPAARRYGRIVAHLPFVRMVAVTGALAMDNTKRGDDIDFLFVTAPGRVWLARAAAIVIVRLSRIAGVRLCPNYILADTALAQERQNLFVAHELAQMQPVAGQALYWRMRAANAWADEYLPNAGSLPRLEPDYQPGWLGRRLQAAIEWLLAGRISDRLETWERTRKTKRFQPQLHQAGSAARLDEEHVQGHFNDYGNKALAAYGERCRRAFSSFDGGA